MFSDEAGTLLNLPGFATLTTLGSDGSPHMTVMWFRCEGDNLRMIAPASAVKVRNLSRDPRAGVVVAHPESQYRYVELRGRAEIVRDDAAARAELRCIAARYVGRRAESYVDELSSDPRVLIVIHPESVRLHLGSSGS